MHQLVEVIVREPHSGVAVCTLRLCIEVRPDTLNGMGALTRSREQREGLDLNAEPVAGRIDAVVHELSHVLDQWATYKRGRRQKPRGIAAFRGVIESAAKECGWTRLDDLTYAAVTEYLGGKVASGAWKGNTYTRNLSAFRSLTRFCKRMKILAEDPLEFAEGVPRDDDQGARAATNEEAAAQLEVSWARSLSDGRARGNRYLYHLCLYLAGCRHSEPARWRWSHLALDEDIPAIHWTSDLQKNGKAIVLPLHPQLAEELRKHRDQMHVLAETVEYVKPRTSKAEKRYVSPDHPQAFVFPRVPTRVTFREDRDRAGIKASDPMRGGFSPHSARKWFETAATHAGIPGKNVDLLMRHLSGISPRYNRPMVEDLAAEIRKLPQIWHNPQSIRADVDNSPCRLTPAQEVVKIGPATPTHANRTTAPTPATHEAHQESRPGRTALAAGAFGRTAQPGSGLGPELQSTIINPVMPRGGLITVDRTWLADTLDRLAAEIRQGAVDGSILRAAGQRVAEAESRGRASGA